MRGSGRRWGGGAPRESCARAVGLAPGDAVSGEGTACSGEKAPWDSEREVRLGGRRRTPRGHSAPGGRLGRGSPSGSPAPPPPAGGGLGQAHGPAQGAAGRPSPSAAPGLPGRKGAGRSTRPLSPHGPRLDPAVERTVHRGASKTRIIRSYRSQVGGRRPAGSGLWTARPRGRGLEGRGRRLTWGPLRPAGWCPGPHRAGPGGGSGPDPAPGAGGGGLGQLEPQRVGR